MVQFLNKCALPNFHVGKIILCYDLRKEQFVVYGNLLDKSSELQNVIVPKDASLRFAEDLMGRFNIHDSRFGDHAEIERDNIEEIIGGAWLAVIGKTLLITGTSFGYGPTSSRIFRRCMPDTYTIVGMSQ